MRQFATVLATRFPSNAMQIVPSIYSFSAQLIATATDFRVIAFITLAKHLNWRQMQLSAWSIPLVGLTTPSADSHRLDSSSFLPSQFAPADAMRIRAPQSQIERVPERTFIHHQSLARISTHRWRNPLKSRQQQSLLQRAKD